MLARRYCAGDFFAMLFGGNLRLKLSRIIDLKTDGCYFFQILKYFIFLQESLLWMLTRRKMFLYKQFYEMFLYLMLMDGWITLSLLFILSFMFLFIVLCLFPCLFSLASVCGYFALWSRGSWSVLFMSVQVSEVNVVSSLFTFFFL